MSPPSAAALLPAPRLVLDQAADSPGRRAGDALDLPWARRPALRVPPVEQWPEAVRSVERLHGTLVRCGPGVRPVAWPETPRVRLAALAPWIGSATGARLVAVGATAAWVWGAMRNTGGVLECSTLGRERRHFPPHPSVALHHYVLPDSDVVWFGDRGVTTRERTLCDLLRSPSALSAVERVACRLLLIGVPGGRPEVHRLLAAGARRQSRIASARLEAL